MHRALAKINFDGDVAALNDILVRKSRIVVNAATFPVLDLTFEHRLPIRLRMGCEQWSERPPSVELLEPDGSPCQTLMPGGIFHAGPHPVVGRPFVCMRGTLEYHTHESHLNEAWDQYREIDGMDLVSIALQIGNTWRRTFP
ncbi:hypothetical protein ACC764_01330 [Rhizobium ruizarguesonis]|uniref:Uncharacterized protein n=1 Tax=Rhizobium ruizarguesonis TaxID=2081791 RepID=A0AAE4YXD6_9HYPH|nr:hypothetical protein [Rhizobium ruizarguesonis]QIJ44771.1 hypothetical protein G7039_31970 [Rhizobium leguminosarum]TCB50266.1 hypothetical protein E0J20_25255 [Rhizobium leguminosarum bv. viciae]NEI24983.1 hypothetical protein [Rhizobium ruizarguesonis]NEI53061.1 hypothetical protein [Rhizobium ruizarguesonis]TAU15464.1 hypothetical protein ELI47_38250 [Rhizobium ruizarguesonis]